MRHDDLYVLVRCGDTGVYGIGGHAHNDQLSFELCRGATPLVEDPGTGTYYESEEERLRFRSTGFHATLRVDGAEQNELPRYPRFPLGNRSRAEAIAWETGPERTTFSGRHHGFEALPAPALHERSFELDARAAEPDDRRHGDQRRRAPARLGLPAGTLRGRLDPRRGRPWPSSAPCASRSRSRAAELAVEDGLYSPAYGVKEPRPFVTARANSAPGRHATTIRLRVE